MRRPRAKRAPRGPRVRTRGGRKGIGIWNAVCRDCKAKFRILHGPKPKHCISCKSKKLDIEPGRINAQERAERDARFAHAASRFVFELLDMFGVPFSPLNAGPYPFPNFEPPPPPPRTRPAMTREEAALFIATYSCTPKDYILDSTEARDAAYRKAARELHPDTGGSHDLFVKLQQAKEALA